MPLPSFISYTNPRRFVIALAWVLVIVVVTVWYGYGFYTYQLTALPVNNEVDYLVDNGDQSSSSSEDVQESIIQPTFEVVITSWQELADKENYQFTDVILDSITEQFYVQLLIDTEGSEKIKLIPVEVKSGCTVECVLYRSMSYYKYSTHRRTLQDRYVSIAYNHELIRLSDSQFVILNYSPQHMSYEINAFLFIDIKESFIKIYEHIRPESNENLKNFGSLVNFDKNMYFTEITYNYDTITQSSTPVQGVLKRVSKNFEIDEVFKTTNEAEYLLIVGADNNYIFYKVIKENKNNYPYNPYKNQTAKLFKINPYTRTSVLITENISLRDSLLDYDERENKVVLYSTTPFYVGDTPDFARLTVPPERQLVVIEDGKVTLDWQVHTYYNYNEGRYLTEQEREIALIEAEALDEYADKIRQESDVKQRYNINGL